MTLSEIRNSIWDALGKPTDLDPATDVQYIGGPLLNFIVNEGQRQIAFWKDPVKQTMVRIHSLTGSLNYSSSVVAGVVATANNTVPPYSITVTGLGIEDDRYNDWLIVINNEARYVVDFVGATGVCYINEAFSTAPEADDVVALYKNFDLLLPSTHAWVTDHIELPVTTDIYRADGNLFEVLSVVNLTNGSELSRSDQIEKFSGTLMNYGDPASWNLYGNKIIYNQAVDSTIWLKLEYYRYPMAMTLADDVPEIPEVYHYGIVLWGIWHGLIRTREASMSQLAWNNLVAFMRSTYAQSSIGRNRTSSHGVIKYS